MIYRKNFVYLLSNLFIYFCVKLNFPIDLLIKVGIEADSSDSKYNGKILFRQYSFPTFEYASGMIFAENRREDSLAKRVEHEYPRRRKKE